MKWISPVDVDDSKLQYEEFFKSANGEYKHYFPTLFLLYINDLPDDVIFDIAIYADDTTL